MLQWLVSMHWMDLELNQDSHVGHFMKEVNVHEVRWIIVAMQH